MIRTWAADITPLLEAECYRKYYREAPEWRREKADRIKPAQNKAQSIGVWSLYANMKRFYALNGKEPYNFSHSGNYVLCSVYIGPKNEPGEIRVGCDVEQMQECRMKLAKRFFCESEYRCLIDTEEGVKRQEVFYRYWVLKESFMKAAGKGMALALDSFEIGLGNPSVLIRQPEEFPETFYYMESELGKGAYRVAVCSTDMKIDAAVREIQLGL